MKAERRRLLAVGLFAVWLLASGAAGQTPMPDQRRILAEARRAAAAASARAAQLTIAAARERDAATRAAIEEQALAERVRGAEAALAVAGARAAIIERQLAVQRARLAAAQAPVARLLAGLQALASRPAIAAVAQPGSVDDLVHLRAVLGSTLPVVRARTMGVRAELARVRGLRRDAAIAAVALRDGRAKLQRDRVALAALESLHRRRAAVLGRGAMSEEDRALALGERARDAIDRMTEVDQGEVTAAQLAILPGPLPRPLASGSVVPPPPPPVYRLPVEGRLVTGFGEMSDSGVRARGLTFVVRPGAEVRAPAGGTVRYARVFRDYGRILILDHGDGWTSLLTGMADVLVEPGATVTAGQPVGRAGRTGGAAGDPARVTVELRRRGRPVDMTALTG